MSSTSRTVAVVDLLREGATSRMSFSGTAYGRVCLVGSSTSGGGKRPSPARGAVEIVLRRSTRRLDRWVYLTGALPAAAAIRVLAAI